MTVCSSNALLSNLPRLNFRQIVLVEEPANLLWSDALNFW